MAHPDDRRVLRSIFLEPKIDSEYRRTAFMMGTNKGELMRKVLDFGDEFLRQEIARHRARGIDGTKFDIVIFQKALDDLLKGKRQTEK